MVVILTSNYDAGVLQFAIQMKNEFNKIYGNSVLFAPKQSGIFGADVELYNRKNSLIPFDRQYRNIATKIEEYKPEFVFVCDTNLITGRIIVNISRSIAVFTVVHDICTHPNYESTMVAIKEIIKKPYIFRGLKRATRIVLLSANSLKGFTEKYPEFSDKRLLLKLGAHVPDVSEEQPPELNNETGYILFFGRLDKYKGIINLLKAFELNKHNIKCKIVIAGKGTITDEEQQIISKYKNSIILLNRYINDGEMIWLFRNASCTVLPYIEASQSGVLSISYYFGIPVIVSDLDGLTEFVKDGETGVVFHSIDELARILEVIPGTAETMRTNIYEYYRENLDWSKNLFMLLKSID